MKKGTVMHHSKTALHHTSHSNINNFNSISRELLGNNNKYWHFKSFHD